MRINPPAASHDLRYVLEHMEDLRPLFHRRRIFISGGTGFFGRWLLESFLAINQGFDCEAGAVVLTRSADAFRAKCPHLAKQDGLDFLAGDVRNFEFPAERFDYIIHAATETVSHDALGTFSTIVDGTRRCLEFAQACGASKFLLTSSGAVYGKQPPGLSHIPEDYSGAPDTLETGAAYGEGKRAAENLCSLYAERSGIECKIARCFAFVGPHLPLDAHFAIGNFIRDAMQGGPIVIQGDGTPLRSYLYAADLAVWLWTILLQAPPLRAFNVGSDQAVSIHELARTVVEAISPSAEVRVVQAPSPGAPRTQYVPSIQRAQVELGLKVGMDLKEAIRRTASWASAGSRQPF